MSIWRFLAGRLQVCPIEFKLKEMEPALGQLITRFRRMFEAQPKRQFAFGAALTCDNVQLLKVHHNKETGGLSVEATKELSLCDTSARLSVTAPGVRVLAMLLAAGRDPHGFKQPFIPVQQLVKGRLLSEYQLLQPAGRAGRAEAPSAAVFRASWKQTHDSSQDSSVHGEHEVYGSISSFDSLTTGHCMDVDEESDKAQADDDSNDVIVKVGVSMKEVGWLQIPNSCWKSSWRVSFPRQCHVPACTSSDGCKPVVLAKPLLSPKLTCVFKAILMSHSAVSGEWLQCGSYNPQLYYNPAIVTLLCLPAY